MVEVLRGTTLESVHRVHVAISDAGGTVVAALGDPHRVTYYRSAAKPLQALPLVEDGVLERFGLDDMELALACASHEGETAHVEGVRRMLAKIGLDEEALACGPHLPYSEEARHALLAAGQVARRVHNNCSGKHAGMLALARAHGWPVEGYHRAGHPVQERMRMEVARWSGLNREAVDTAVDGCGVVSFAVPLGAMAGSLARFAAAAAVGEPPARVVEAMTTHPFMVGGTRRACTEVMRRTGRRAFVKLGAEGVYVGGLPEEGIGFALKVEDGGRRAGEVAMIRVLEVLDALTGDDLEALADLRRPRIRNTRDEVVGEIRASFDIPGLPG